MRQDLMRTPSLFDTPISRRSSSSSVGSAKSVRFNTDIAVVYTHSPQAYDRTSHEVATLTFKDYVELLQMRALTRRQQQQRVEMTSEP